MITLEKADRDWQECTSCQEKAEYKIAIGTQHHSTSFKLCKKCKDSLVSKLDTAHQLE